MSKIPAGDGTHSTARANTKLTPCKAGPTKKGQGSAGMSRVLGGKPKGANARPGVGKK